jgi:hypothetical protein
LSKEKWGKMVGAWFSEHAWLYHYEVVVRRHGREQILARVPSRRQAEFEIAHVNGGVEVSRQTISWRRARGVHPVNLAKFALVLLLMVLLLPWAWPRLVFSLLCTALICGALSSGTSWKHGGEDDR